jgi:hypothetical protein
MTDSTNGFRLIEWKEQQKKMSHIVKMPKGDRVSLETHYVLPGQPLLLGIALYTQGLKLVALAEDGSVCQTCDIVPDRTSKPALPVFKLTFKGRASFRVELRMGDAMWDWMRVDTTKVPKDAADYSAKGTGKVKVEVVWTKQPASKNPMPHYKTVAEMMLKTHGYKLDIKGFEYSDTRKLNFGDIIVGVGGDNGNLGGLSQALSSQMADYNRGDKLYVVVGPARQNADQTKDPGNLAGQTVEKAQGATGKPYVVINVDNPSSDGATLLHEMCHAAGYHHGDKNGVEDKDEKNVMSYGTRRNLVHKDHIEDLQKAFFHED